MSSEKLRMEECVLVEDRGVVKDEARRMGTECQGSC